jgi:O-antigen ligase
MAHFLRACAYVVIFLLARDLAQSRREGHWALAAPLLAVAALQASLGILPILAGEAVEGVHGTYVNRNHFAGLLEMALPFAVLYAIKMLRQIVNSDAGFRSALLACVSVLLAALLLAGILLSFSRAAFAATALSSAVLAWIGLRWRARTRPSRLRRWVPRASGALAGTVFAASLFLWLPSEPLLARFAALGGAREFIAEGRVQLWKDTLAMIGDYPLVGCGLGAYVSVFAKYNTAALPKTDDYAHNDFLQLLAELGIVGFVMAAGLLLTPWIQGLRRMARTEDGETRLLLLAAFGGITALLLHSLADFNLYIPANASALAWILGLAAGAGQYETPYPRSLEPAI